MWVRWKSSVLKKTKMLLLRQAKVSYDEGTIARASLKRDRLSVLRSKRAKRTTLSFWGVVVYRSYRRSCAWPTAVIKALPNSTGALASQQRSRANNHYQQLTSNTIAHWRGCGYGPLQGNSALQNFSHLFWTLSQS